MSKASSLVAALALAFMSHCWGAVTSIVSDEFDTSQLPIAQKLGCTFPSVAASHFIIVSGDLGLVVHESNSTQALQCAMQSDSIMYEATLYDLCRSFGRFPGSSSIETHGKLSIYFFEASQANLPSRVGCVFRYKNKNMCEFVGAVCWARSKEDAITKAQSIAKWLDQFYVFDVTYDTDATVEIPVFYGVRNAINASVPKSQKLLLSEKVTNEISRTIKYRIAIAAPTMEGDIVGSVQYTTPTFQKPLTKSLHAQHGVEKAGLLKTISDSLKYAIFGPSANRVSPASS
ncbi:MAG: hypothetical protein LBJ69_01485 [Holosporales bacterium]|nr:hypothetical protein [Holosporales bacterium]